jgi:hypothetical protein
VCLLSYPLHLRVPCTRSNYDTDAALSALAGRLPSLLALWTSAEQQSIGQAFDRVSDFTTAVWSG